MHIILISSLSLLHPALLGCPTYIEETSYYANNNTSSHRIYSISDTRLEMQNMLYNHLLSFNFYDNEKYSSHANNTIKCMKSSLNNLRSELLAIGIECPALTFEKVTAMNKGADLNVWTHKSSFYAIKHLFQFLYETEQLAIKQWQLRNAFNAQLVSETMNTCKCYLFDIDKFKYYLKKSYPSMSEQDIEKRLLYMQQVQLGHKLSINKYEYAIDHLIMSVAICTEFKTWQYLLKMGYRNKDKIESSQQFYINSISFHFNKALLGNDIWATKIQKPKKLHGKIQLYGYFDKTWQLDSKESSIP